MKDEHDLLAAWLRTGHPLPSDLPEGPRGRAKFVRVAISSGLAGVVLEQAAAQGVSIPSGWTGKLRQASLSAAADNMRLRSELEGIARAFNQAGVPVMLLKGAALTPTIYARPDLRPMSDLDLLIRPEDVSDAFAALERHGCRRGLDLLRDDFFPKFYYEVEFVTAAPRPARIDLHVRPFRPLRVSRMMPDDALWEGAETVRVGDAEAFVPRPEFMFIHLAVHAAFHGFGRLLWLYDLKRFVDVHQQSLDWTLVAQRARQWRLSLPVLRAIERTRDLLGLAVPRAAIEGLTCCTTSWRDRLTLVQAPRDAASPAAHILVNLLCTPGIRFRMAYLAALLLPGSKHLADIYPFRHWGWTTCAYIWRLARGLGRAVSAAWGGPIRVIRRTTERKGVRLTY